ncbi:hypothetical protein COLO4_35561 [Corchorus olitorius]|uniref:Uncharacterized protein n=1 Tax=Corchorus olitorius TaxID=93759 RepID=A0A1R3GFF8_9ROSI|nr:hypothetical protein COLO4_35561 [Corchorus olitorius]
MVPTEEYLDLLKVPVGVLGKVYWRNFQTQVQKKMTAITGIKSQTWGEQLRELKRLNPNSTGFKADFLLRWADASPEYREWHGDRIKDIFLPPPKDLQYSIGEDARDELTHLRYENERLRNGAEMREIMARHEAEEAWLQKEIDDASNFVFKMSGEWGKMKNEKDECQKKHDEVVENAAIDLLLPKPSSPELNNPPHRSCLILGPTPRQPSSFTRNVEEAFGSSCFAV